MNTINIKALSEQVSKLSASVGSDLPEVTSADNGMVLGVVEGSWNKMDAPSGVIDYSETEQNTGRKWIDGKDIYSITISGETSTGVTFEEDLTDLNIDTVVNFEVIGKNANYNVPVYYASASDMLNCYYSLTEKKFVAYPDSTGFFGTVYATLYYTKATVTSKATKKKTTK